MSTQTSCGKCGAFAAINCSIEGCPNQCTIGSLYTDKVGCFHSKTVTDGDNILRCLNCGKFLEKDHFDCKYKETLEDHYRSALQHILHSDEWGHLSNDRITIEEIHGVAERALKRKIPTKKQPSAEEFVNDVFKEWQTGNYTSMTSGLVKAMVVVKERYDELS